MKHKLCTLTGTFQLSISVNKRQGLSASHVFELSQPLQEEQKEAEIKEEPREEAEIQQDGEKKEEELEEKEKEDKEEGQKENPVKEKKAEKKSEEAKGSKRQKTIQCKVIMLDDSQFECELDVRCFLDDSKCF